MTEHMLCCRGPHQTCLGCRGTGMILEFKMGRLGLDRKVISLPQGSRCSHCAGRGFFCRSGIDCPGDTDCVPEVIAHLDPPV